MSREFVEIIKEAKEILSLAEHATSLKQFDQVILRVTDKVALARSELETEVMISG